MKIRILSREDVRRAVTMTEAIDIVEGAFVQLSAGQAIVPVQDPDRRWPRTTGRSSSCPLTSPPAMLWE